MATALTNRGTSYTPPGPTAFVRGGPSPILVNHPESFKNKGLASTTLLPGAALYYDTAGNLAPCTTGGNPFAGIGCENATVGQPVTAVHGCRIDILATAQNVGTAIYQSSTVAGGLEVSGSGRVIGIVVPPTGTNGTTSTVVYFYAMNTVS